MADEKKKIDTCPICREKSLVAVCQVIVEYDIHNEVSGGQDWTRESGDAVDDDSSNVLYVKCVACGHEWSYDAGQVELDDQGLLVGLLPLK